MQTMKHPRFDNVFETVADESVEDWKASGWVPADDETAVAAATEAAASSGESATASSARRRTSGASGTAGQSE